MRSLKQAIPHSQELKEVESHFDALLTNSHFFVMVMKAPVIDWDKAREHLASLALLDKKLHQSSVKLSEILEDLITNDSLLAVSYMNQLLMISALFSLLFIVSGCFLVRVNLHRLDALNKQKIHLDFPIKNPTPVMGLDEFGVLIFANPASTKWALKFGLIGPLSLLPVNINEYLIKHDKMLDWEYDNGVAILKIRLLWLKEHRRYHVYIDDLSELKMAEKRLIKRSLTNGLTLLPNRKCFNLDVSNNETVTEAFALINVSDFQHVINTSGQNVIDRVILKASRLINECLDSDSAQLYRFDGNLFGVRFKNKQDYSILEVIIRSFDLPLKVAGLDFYFSLNIGLIVSEDNQLSADELLMKAGVALDFSRKSKGKIIQPYEAAIEKDIQKKHSLEIDLHKALSNDELEVYYQPKVEVGSRKIISAEALLRWHRKGKEWVSPFDFIPIAEKTGLIIAIGEWVLKKACLNAKQWNRQCSAKISVAVNLSSVQFIHGDLVEKIKSILTLTGLEAKYLQLEITESLTLHDIDFVIAELNKLKALGIRVALDDFGTGFSSLTYLNALPIDYLKIDQSFIRRMFSSKKDSDITHSMIKLAHDLGLCVIAEGVEEEAQYEQLKKWQCDQIQGYLFAKPMPFKAFCHKLDNEASKNTSP